MNLASYGKAIVLLLLVDAFWLLTGGIYLRRMIEDVQRESLKPRYISALFVYVFLAYMLLETTSYMQAFMYGVCIYAVYDFTNYAVFERYDWKLGVMDTLWGGVLFVVTRYLLLRVF